MIETVGIARIIQITQNKLAQIIIASKTAKGESSRFLLITYGTSTLFSVCWIAIYKINTAINALYQIQAAMAIAGSRAMKGHIYGTNSIIHAIRASEKYSLISIQNNLRISSHIKVRKKILIHKISCHFNQLVRLLIILSSLESMYLEYLAGITL